MKLYRKGALEIAKKVKTALGDNFKQISLVGSLARGAERVTNIDILIMPKLSVNNFLLTIMGIHGFDTKVLSRGNPYYKEFQFGGIPVNFHFCTNEKLWFIVRYFRTSSKGYNQDLINRGFFSKAFLFDKLPPEFKLPDKNIEKEEDVCKLLGLEYCHPKQRILEKE